MGIIFANSCVGVFSLLTATVAGVIGYYMWCFKYWERRNVPYVSPKFPFGTMTNPIFELESIGDRIRRQYLKFRETGHKHVGLFNFCTPLYMPLDHKYIERILTNDFNHFVDRGICCRENDEPSSANLFFIEGEKWKILRTKLENVFSPSNSELVFPILLKSANQLKKAVDDVASNQGAMDVRAVLDHHIINVIFTCIFGVEFNRFDEPNSDIVRNINRIFTCTKIEQLRNFLFAISPNMARLLGFRFVQKEPTEFFAKLIADTVKHRKQVNPASNDFLQILIDTKMNTNEREGLKQHKEGNLTMDELVAQLLLFFIAGYETLTTTLAFCLFELALDQEIQQKLRKEIKGFLMKSDSALTYDAIINMAYMDTILKETMRKYPAVPVLNRRCTSEYKIPETNIIIENGTDLVIPIIGLHHDKIFHPDPQKFDPERFNRESNYSNPNSSTYFPFGQGPRICLGAHFAVIQMKLALVVLLENYSFSLNSRTQLPLKMSPFSIVLSSTETIWLDVTKLKE